MSLVTAELVCVKRKRRLMEKSLEQFDWDAIKKIDKELIADLDKAFDNPSRDNSSLCDELEKILELYGKVVAALPESTVNDWLSLGTVKD